MAVITELGKLKPEDQEVKVTLQYIVRFCFKEHDNEAYLSFHRYNSHYMP